MAAMKPMNMIAYAALLVYIVYGFVSVPGVQYLVSLAVGGVVYTITESIEITVLSILAASIVFSILMYRQLVATAKKEGFMSANPTEIAARLRQLRQGEGVKGVMAVGAEGFEDAGATDMTLSNPEKKTESQESSGPASAAASGMAGVDPAMAAQAKAVLESLTAQLNGAGGAAAGAGAAARASTASTAPAPSATTAASAAAQPATPPAPAQAQAQGFQGAAAEPPGLFKLGALPSDAAGGYHIDAGTTVMNALKALKPDQIKAMTQDTQKLIETQKSLMDMLRTFKPMMSEGKEMMETFSQLFSPTAPSQPPVGK